jgi:hypothetical protein
MIHQSTLTKSVVQERLLGVLLAIGILLFACGWEAYRFSQAITSWRRAFAKEQKITGS